MIYLLASIFLYLLACKIFAPSLQKPHHHQTFIFTKLKNSQEIAFLDNSQEMRLMSRTQEIKLASEKNLQPTSPHFPPPSDR